MGVPVGKGAAGSIQERRSWLGITIDGTQCVGELTDIQETGGKGWGAEWVQGTWLGMAA
jgi:hypothetical protein